MPHVGIQWAATRLVVRRCRWTIDAPLYRHLVINDHHPGTALDNRLRELRETNGWSQQELGERLGVSRQTIISIEKGKYDPSLPLAFAIAREFECRIEDVFFPDEE